MIFYDKLFLNNFIYLDKVISDSYNVRQNIFNESLNKSDKNTGNYNNNKKKITALHFQKMRDQRH